MSLSKKKDILEKLRKMFDVAFMTKQWIPTIANKMGAKLTIEDLIPMILRSVRLRLTMEKIRRTGGYNLLEMQDIVTLHLERLGHHRNMSVIRWVGLALCSLIKKNYSGIMVDEESIERVKAIMGTNPVIFAPSHRSYADFILMSFLCFYYDIEIPVIAAGQDFQSMWVMGRVLRECCAFFIRRSFGADYLYKAVIAEYVNLLIQLSHTALEFFIEGARSRSGKSLLPKFGLMTMALEPYFFGKVPDITIIPINITYERCLEDGLFARELLGVPKPKESTKLLLRALQALNENYGRIFVQFGEPISVKKFCAADMKHIDPRVDLNQASSFYQEPRYPGPRVSQCVKDLSYLVVREQNKLLTFLPIHIMAASVSVWQVFGNRISLVQVETDMKYLQEILLILGYSTVLKDEIEEEIFETLNLHNRAMYFCTKEQAVKLNVTLSSSSAEDNALQGSQLTQKTLAEAFPVVFLQHYANSVCLACIHVCILNFVLCTGDDVKEYTKADLFEDYVFFRSLFQVEFVLTMDDDDLNLHDFETAVRHMCSLNLFLTFSENKDNVNLSNMENLRNSDCEALLLGLLHPFLAGYKLILSILLVMTINIPEYPERKLKFLIQKSIEDELSLRHNVPKYILSMDLITNAILAYARIGAIQRLPKNKIMMVRPVVPVCRAMRNNLENRLRRLECQLLYSYHRVNYEYCRKHKLSNLCKL